MKRLNLLFCLLLLITGTAIAQDATCPLPPRLQIGEQGRVLPGDPNRLRPLPTTREPQHNEIPSGGVFTVLDGPVCADGYNWWQVDYKGNRGWTAEGGDGVYWVGPITAVAIPISRENITDLQITASLGYGYVDTLRWDDNDTLMLIGGGGIWQFNAESLQDVPQWQRHPSPSNSRIVGSNANFDLLVYTETQDGTFNQSYLWDVQQQQAVYVFVNTSISTAIFSNDGQYAAFLWHKKYPQHKEYQEEIVLWHIESGQEHMRFLYRNDAIEGLAFSENDQFLIGTSYYQTLVWEIASGEIARQFEYHMEFSPDNFHAARSTDNRVEIYNLLSNQIERVIPVADTEVIIDVKYNHDGKYMAVFANNPERAHNGPYGMDANIYIYETISGTLLLSDATRLNGLRDPVQFSSDNRYVAISAWNAIYSELRDNNRIRLWNIQNGLLIADFPDDFWRSTVDMAFSPDNTKLGVARIDGTLQLIDTYTGKMIHRRVGYPGYNEHVAFSPDGQKLVMSGDHTRIWDLVRNILIAEFEPCGVVAFHPNGNVITCGKRGTSEIWLVDVRTGTNIRRIHWTTTNNSNSVFNLAISPDGQWLAIGDYLGAVDLWDVETGNFVRHFQDKSEGYNNMLFGLAFSPDGKLLAAGPPGRIWDVETGELLVELEIRMAWHSNLAFSPDGKSFAFPVEHPSKDTLMPNTVSIHVWSLEDLLRDKKAQLGEEIIVIETGIYGYISMAYSPDSQLLARDGMVIYDTSTGDILFNKPVWGRLVAFTPDGTGILTADGFCICGAADESYHIGIAQLWGIPVED